MAGDKAMTEFVDGANLSVDRFVTQDHTVCQWIFALDDRVDGVSQSDLHGSCHILDAAPDRGDVFFQSLFVVGHDTQTPFLATRISYRLFPVPARSPSPG